MRLDRWLASLAGCVSGERRSRIGNAPSLVVAQTGDLAQSGDKVFMAVTFHARGRRSGAEVAWSVVTVWTLRDGMITRGQTFTERAEVLEAAGLAE